MLMKSYEEIRKELLDLFERKDYRSLKHMLPEMNVVDIAEFISEVEPHDAGILFRMLPKTVGAEVFAFLDQDAQTFLLEAYTDSEIEEIVNGLCNDDYADMLEEVPASVAKRLLSRTDPERRKLINLLLRYPEDSAGSIMTTEYMRLNKDMTVAEAIQKLRHASPNLETINTSFVTTSDRILEGIVTIRQLLTSPDDAIVRDIMEENVVFARTLEDREYVSRLFDRYDFLAIPVVDNEDRLVGIITIDDALDTLSEETTEDFALMGKTQPSEKPYLETSVWQNAKNRVIWLLILMISGMVNGSILANYEHAFVVLPVLVTFIPMLTDTGGNAGQQSSTLLIRAIALNEVKLSDIGKVLWRELRIGLMVGGVLASINVIRIYFANGRNLILALTVSGALYAAVIIAKLIAGSLPLLARALKLDPALMVAPIITTLVDALTLIIYFNFARLFLGL